MIFVSKWVRLSRAEYPAGARPTINPTRHGLVEANHPPRYELLHVLIPLRNHLPDLPKPIPEGGRIVLRED